MLPISAPEIGVVPRCTEAFPGTVLCGTKHDKVPYSIEGASSVTSVTSVAGDAVLDDHRPISASPARRPRRLDRRARLPRHHRRRHRPPRSHVEAHVLRPVRQQGAVLPGAAAGRQSRNSARASGRRSIPRPTGTCRFVRPSRPTSKNIESRPAITLSWIRELPSLGDVARPVQRRGLQLLTSLLIDLSASPGFRRADLPPLTAPLAVILLGGLRELTALAVEDGKTRSGRSSNRRWMPP